jgi:hypothetical protein
MRPFQDGCRRDRDGFGLADRCTERDIARRAERFDGYAIWIDAHDLAMAPISIGAERYAIAETREGGETAHAIDRRRDVRHDAGDAGKRVRESEARRGLGETDERIHRDTEGRRPPFTMSRPTS